jgi:hypothetical protein
MDAGQLDVLHHPGDDYLFSITDCVHVVLEGLLQKLVDEDGPMGRDIHGASHVVDEHLAVMHYLHAAALAGDGSLIRIRVAPPPGGRNMYYQRVPNPGPGSDFSTWTYSGQSDMLAVGLLRQVEVLKVGHHGANNASSLSFLAVTRPEVAVIQADVDTSVIPAACFERSRIPSPKRKAREEGGLSA